MAITQEVQESLLRVAVRMAEVRHPERQEATLGEIAQRLDDAELECSSRPDADGTQDE